MWKQAVSPDPGGQRQDVRLFGVTATSAGNAWAVGNIFSDAGDRAIVLHWNGSQWASVTIPNPGQGNDLFGVRTLVLHWNGRGWTRVASPDPAGAGNENSLRSVSATSARNALAVGRVVSGGQAKTLIMQWNGTRWAAVASPNPGTINNLLTVAAKSGSNAWAVGTFASGGPGHALALHCC